MRFVFSPPAGEAARLLTLPWELPLDEWQDERLVEVRQRGISRHVVRFVSDSCELYALKSISEHLARREYRLLRALGRSRRPRGRSRGHRRRPRPGHGRDPGDQVPGLREHVPGGVLPPRGAPPTDRLLDALVELLARLHLSGFFWGDCSLSNALFRADAGAFEAYLVDTETSERHPTLTDGQRGLDLDIAMERVCGELMDLQAGELLSADLDPIDIERGTARRYQASGTS